MTWSPADAGTTRLASHEEARVTGPEDVSHPAVRAAMDAVLTRWTNDRGDAAGAEDAPAVLAELGGVVADHAGGRQRTPGTRCASVLGRHLLDLLRTELLRRWAAEPAPGGTMLSLLNAIESVRRTIEPDWDHYFASRLSGPDGLDLVVEVAHDLRSPLTSIIFLAETLQRGRSGDVNDVQRRQLGLIYGAALGLSAVASDVMELARGGDRLVDDDMSPFSITETFESVRDIVRPIAEEKGLSIRLLPPATDHRLGHPLALSRVLLNLTTNALKFTDQGFVEIVARAKDLAVVEFSVRDTGPGINPAMLESLYQPFRRSKSRGAGYAFSGTGLGLAICRKLVEAMRSELRVESRPDWGTRFYFDLSLPAASQL